MRLPTAGASSRACPRVIGRGQHRGLPLTAQVLGRAASARKPPLRGWACPLSRCALSALRASRDACTATAPTGHSARSQVQMYALVLVAHVSLGLSWWSLLTSKRKPINMTDPPWQARATAYGHCSTLNATGRSHEVWHRSDAPRTRTSGAPPARATPLPPSYPPHAPIPLRPLPPLFPPSQQAAGHSGMICCFPKHCIATSSNRAPPRRLGQSIYNDLQQTIARSPARGGRRAFCGCRRLPRAPPGRHRACAPAVAPSAAARSSLHTGQAHAW